MIAALYVQADGAYANMPGVDLWPESRDARTYAGPWPVVAHPPCERWGRFWFGSPRKAHEFELGDDNGCFTAALHAVRTYGGVLEHPAYSRAWLAHELPWPTEEGWQKDIHGGWCCQVEQGFYGHKGKKPTWLYAVRTQLPSLRWGTGGQRVDPAAIQRLGYTKARRSGWTGSISRKHRQVTPPAFRDLLLSIAASASHAG